MVPYFQFCPCRFVSLILHPNNKQISRIALVLYPQTNISHCVFQKSAHKKLPQDYWKRLFLTGPEPFETFPV